jgi:integrase
MAGKLHKLSVRKVETVKRPGRYSDGGGLYLKVRPTGSRQWVFMYARIVGKDEGTGKDIREQREIGLGGAGAGGLSLSEAREKADAYRFHRLQGRDPRAEKLAAQKSTRTIPTFGAFADDYIAAHRPKFRNAKHAAQWKSTLGESYCRAIRSLPISEIDTEAVLKVLQPIWQTVPETASRLRGRIENVLDAARAMGFRSGENPAAWRGHLKTLLPARQRLTRGHHAALAYDDLPAFVAELRARQSIAGAALEFCILTATRSGEVLNAKWTEFDLKKAVWTIPGTRMKAGHEHRVPLSVRAIQILNDIPRLNHNPHVFPGNARGKPLSAMAMSMLLRRMKREKITVHGFRSCFRDWASEQTSFPHETCEHALAHRISDKAEAAYGRGDQFQKRRQLMDAWAIFCGESGGTVIALGRSRGSV